MKYIRSIMLALIVACMRPLLVQAADAIVGQPAPEFTLTDTTGHTQSLSAQKGKCVVLEWSNHECPFVRKHYGSGNMQKLQASAVAKGVVWFTVVSSAFGKQGHVLAEQAEVIRKQRGDVSTAMLLDADGVVGKRYGAKTTPHMFVVNPQGVLIYAGAIDDKPSVDPADVARATNYVQRALDEVMAGQPVSTPQTTSYGCSIKY